jgi:hypothetical protein
MVVVENKPGRFFKILDDAGASAASGAALDGSDALSIEDLFIDPEVCRRVGNIIAKGAHKPPAKKPDPAN